MLILFSFGCFGSLDLFEDLRNLQASLNCMKVNFISRVNFAGFLMKIIRFKILEFQYLTR